MKEKINIADILKDKPQKLSSRIGILLPLNFLENVHLLVFSKQKMIKSIIYMLVLIVEA